MQQWVWTPFWLDTESGSHFICVAWMFGQALLEPILLNCNNRSGFSTWMYPLHSFRCSKCDFFFFGFCLFCFFSSWTFTAEIMMFYRGMQNETRELFIRKSKVTRRMLQASLYLQQIGDICFYWSSWVKSLVFISFLVRSIHSNNVKDLPFLT